MLLSPTDELHALLCINVFIEWMNKRCWDKNMTMAWRIVLSCDLRASALWAPSFYVKKKVEYVNWLADLHCLSKQLNLHGSLFHFSAYTNRCFFYPKWLTVYLLQGSFPMEKLWLSAFVLGTMVLVNESPHIVGFKPRRLWLPPSKTCNFIS